MTKEQLDELKIYLEKMTAYKKEENWNPAFEPTLPDAIIEMSLLGIWAREYGIPAVKSASENEYRSYSTDCAEADRFREVNCIAIEALKAIPGFKDNGNGTYSIPALPDKKK